MEESKNRKDYISWDHYFMGLAFMSALRSKDPSTRHGCCIVDPKTNKILSLGYNGMPNGRDDVYSWEREGTPNKNDFVLHAEENAILNATQSIKDSMMFLYSEKLYIPCKNCMRLIVQAGIKEIILNGILKENTDIYNWEPTKFMIQMEGIEIGVLNNPIGMFKKFKEESDKAIVMYEKAADKRKTPEESYDLVDMVELDKEIKEFDKDGEEITEELIDEDIKN